VGRCLFGTGMGQAVEVLMLSSERVGVRGCGEADRVCIVGRGKTIVDMF